MMRSVPLAFICALAKVCALPSQLEERVGASSPTVTLSQGTIVGVATQLPSASVSVNKFLGVPFAVSPPKRFEPPVAVPAGTGTIQATQWSAKCIEQGGFPGLSDTAPESEDCLYLNVYAPATSTPNKAVMFWIYGGDLEFGNAGQAAYDGTSFATYQDVIIVAANYRTNVFGFSNSPQLPVTSRNAGFYDQRLALQWVQQNIAAFGGDPTKVTIFGESSGASSTDRLLTAPPNPLPYRAAILESGQASVSPIANKNGPQYWNQLMSDIGCSGASDVLACAQAVNATIIKSKIGSNQFSPVNDMVTQKATPLLAARSSGNAANVPLMIGTNGLEGGLFIAPLFQAVNGDINYDTITTLLTGTLGAAVSNAVTNTIKATLGLGIVPIFDLVAGIITDVVYKCPASLVSHASASLNPTWRYIFNATFPDTQAFLTSPQLGLNNVGAFHSSEIPLVFGTYDTYSNYAPSTANERQLSSFMQGAWASFAKNPSQGPGWNRVNAMGVQDIACLGCDANPTGTTMQDELFIDASCALYNLLYLADQPMF